MDHPPVVPSSLERGKDFWRIVTIGIGEILLQTFIFYFIEIYHVEGGVKVSRRHIMRANFREIR